ncbi:uncharacterized protein LOC127856831 [Dreissena polymorpha]|uniref:JmjC domain-containing protein n=1 Tax=Dreissena polymorpha TaxID=45954 RepID=A0A9D4BWK2_DREPO|nr:uncharacterized protein LOC127856831 [Dreissena polymorpha]KAH3712264.1 hypothetical protein DPMN_071954 [Dreissena polymorpha]
MTRFTFAALVLGTYLLYVDGKTSFIKDMKTDVPFPPVNTQNVPGIPEGHLRPLGWQRKPEGKVREEKDALSPSTFYIRYVKTGRPAVMRGVLKEAAVTEKWEEDTYLKEKYGMLNMTITVKKEVMNRDPHTTKRRMLFRKFLMDYKYENWYLTSTVHEVMRKELPLPDVLSCGTYRDRLTEAEVWMSSGGTASLLHSHGDHNVHCVLDGRKDFILIEDQYQSVFNFEPTYPNSGSGHSPMDMDMINAYKNPKIAETPWVWSTLWQGDCIFVPAGYLHQVRAFGRSISYTVQFAPSVTYESVDCPDEAGGGKRKKKEKKASKGDTEPEAENRKLSLADVEFMWTYSDGEMRLSDRALVPRSLRRLLLLLLRDGDQLHRDQFVHFYEDSHAHEPNLTPTPDEVFHLMTPNNARVHLSREEILALSDSRLQSVCDLLNKKDARVKDEL